MLLRNALRCSLAASVILYERVNTEARAKAVLIGGTLSDTRQTAYPGDTKVFTSEAAPGNGSAKTH